MKKIKKKIGDYKNLKKKKKKKRKERNLDIKEQLMS